MCVPKCAHGRARKRGEMLGALPTGANAARTRCWPQPPGEGAACSTMQRAGGFLETTSAADLQRSWQKYVSKLLPALSPGSR